MLNGKSPSNKLHLSHQIKLHIFFVVVVNKPNLNSKSLNFSTFLTGTTKIDSSISCALNNKNKQIYSKNWFRRHYILKFKSVMFVWIVNSANCSFISFGWNCSDVGRKLSFNCAPVKLNFYFFYFLLNILWLIIMLRRTYDSWFQFASFLIQCVFI